MKYLRLFENHEYYVEIPWDEFNEWYYVELFGGYLWYKCDQLEGLKKLIEKY